MIVKTSALVLQCCLLTACVCFISALAKADLDDDLIAYYPLDGNANDLSGNGYNGTVYGATPTADRFGVGNSALLFNGEGDYVSTTFGNGVTYPNGFSVQAWVKGTGMSNGGIVISRGDPEVLFGIHAHEQGFPRMQLNGRSAKSSISVNDGDWHHVVGTFDASAQSLRVYVDGVGSASDPASDPPASADVFKIGWDDYSSTQLHRYFSGAIDDVRLYDRTLSQSEVVALYAGSPAPPRDHTPSPPAPTIDRLGRWNGSDFESVAEDSITSGNVHVLVHGWGPGLRDEADAGLKAWDDGVDGADRYKALAESIEGRDPGSTVLMYNWLDDSSTEGVDWGYQLANRASQSRSKTDVNGHRLATAMYLACGMEAGNDPDLHFVGHSHGARVAAIAAWDLQRLDRQVEHLTVMDSPEIGHHVAFGNWAGAINHLHNAFAKLDYGRDEDDTFVENYFSLLGGTYADVAGDIVNVKLVPQDGWFAPVESHDYPKEWYAKANESGSTDIGVAWSPLLGTYYQGLDSHYVQDWETAPGLFDEFRELVLRSETGTIGPDYREEYPLGYLSLLTEGDVVTDDAGATLTEQSPAYWDVLFETGPDDIALEFEYEFLDGGDGDELGLWIDGELRFLMAGYLAPEGVQDSIIDITDLEVGEHVLTVALHSYGDPNASVYVGDFMGVTPEPATLALLVLGGLGLLGCRKSSKAA